MIKNDKPYSTSYPLNAEIKKPIHYIIITAVAVGAISLIVIGISIHLNLIVMSPVLAIGLEATGGVILGILGSYLIWHKASKNKTPSQNEEIDIIRNDSSPKRKIHKKKTKKNPFSHLQSDAENLFKAQLPKGPDLSLRANELENCEKNENILHLKIYIDENNLHYTPQNNFIDKFPNVTRVEFIGNSSKEAIYSLPICNEMDKNGFVLNMDSTKAFKPIPKEDIEKYCQKKIKVYHDKNGRYYVKIKSNIAAFDKVIS